MLRRLRRAAAADGFTLIEFLGIALVPLTAMLTSVASSSNITMNQDALLTEARSVVEVIVTDVREAYTSSSSMPAIVSMNGTQLTFYAPDSQQPFHLMEISYRLSGGNLQRAFATSTNTGGPPWSIPAPGGWTTVIGSVSNSTIFTYQDANGNATTDPTKVSRVLVSLTITPSDGGPATTYQDSSTIRGTT